ncbi:hypothetical protein LO763_21480 [Glycomyces sp. A-F 0318]|uniref:hypothetical protein n=1 Tax=Glycomyces amatae TaxID=2881355 RepID=UPI001E50EAD0|nr:hypothetical protein [Glycomyces amatae]MCD0446188.1 hypothetical protein [Glycomyces amatae]
MVEMVLAGVIIGAVSAAAAVSGLQDRRRRRAERRGTEAPVFGEPIPSGWAHTARGDGRGRAEGGR